jgi:hypothetical protein
MAGNTTRLDLNTFDGGDPFSETPFNQNWSKLDAAPGVHVCTSSTRPAYPDWDTDQIGRLIFETDTKRLYEYIGSSNYSLIADGAMPTPQTDYSDANITISNTSTSAAPTILDSGTHVFKTFTRPIYCLISWQVAVTQSAAAGQQDDVGCFGWAYRTGNTIDTGTLSALQGRLQISQIEHTGTSGATVSLSGSEIFLAGAGATMASPKGHTFYCAGYKSGLNWDGATTAQRITVTPIR